MGIEDKKITRREFLNLGILASIAVAASSGIYTVLKYLYPPAEAPQQAGENMLVAKVEEVPDGGTFLFRYKNKPSILLNSKNGIIALNIVCPHLGCIVKWEESKHVFLCPCHAGIFDASGSVISGPPPAPLKKLNVTIKEGKIYVGEA